MSRYRGPKLRIIRKLGKLPGLTQKVPKKTNFPGQQGNIKKTPTEYRLRLEEKQKLKFNYGLTENQLYQYVKEARRQKGITGLILFQLLGMRLDNICFSLGIAKTISAARQIINHGHIYVNYRLVDLPSFQCRPKDIISIKQNLKSQTLVETNLKNNRFLNLFSHLQFDSLKLEGVIQDYCKREDIILQLNELKVIEYYSRR